MPINGLVSAANALRYWERRQEVTANNLANVSTDGFKAERVFALLAAGGAPEAAASTDLRVGTLRATGNPLDVALGDASFLVVSTPAGERYTRGGALQIRADGVLADADGHALLGVKGPIAVRGAPVVIGRDGVVSVGGRPVDELRLERAPAGVSLAHEGGTHFVPAATRTVLAPRDRDVRQGTLEESNVDSLGGLVDLIGVQRAYAAVERSISILDRVRETATTQLGKPV